MTDTETPEAPIPEESETLSCSFCGKSQRDVKKLIAGLIAGPGSCICYECVGRFATMISEDAAREHFPSDEQLAAEWLAVLKARARSAQTAEAELTRLVRQARTKGLEWTSIANSLGISADEAGSRYG